MWSPGLDVLLLRSLSAFNLKPCTFSPQILQFTQETNDDSFVIPELSEGVALNSDQMKSHTWSNDKASQQ